MPDIAGVSNRAMSQRPPTPLLIIFALLGLATVYYSASAGFPLRYFDETDYLQIADNVVNGLGYSRSGEPTAYRPPVWTLILAAALYVNFPIEWLTTLSALFICAAAAIAGYIGMRLSRNRWGYIAGIAVLLSPLNLYTAATLYPQAFATFCILLLWALASMSMDNDYKPLAIPPIALMGITSALLALAVPTMIPTAAAIGIWTLWSQRGNRLRFACVGGFFALLPVALWTVRNAAVMGSPVLFSTSSGRNLFLGNNPTTTGSSGLAADIPSVTVGAENLGELESNAFFSDYAYEWIRNNPTDAMILYFQKLLNYFSGYNAPVTENTGGQLEQVISWVVFSALVSGTILRFALAKQHKIRPTETLMLSVFILNAFTMSVFFTRTRFRQPLDNILIIESSVAIVIALVLITAKVRQKRVSVE